MPTGTITSPDMPQTLMLSAQSGSRERLLRCRSCVLQGLMLIFIGPFMDQAVSKKWIFDYDYNVPAMGYLFFSCAVAVLVNISQFMCLGRFSAVTFQVRAVAVGRVLCTGLHSSP